MQDVCALGWVLSGCAREWLSQAVISISSILVCPSSTLPPLSLSLSVSRFLCAAEETWTVPSFCEYHTHILLCNFASLWAKTHTHTQRLPYCTCWIIFGVTNWGSSGETDSLNASQSHEKRLIYDKMKESGSSQTVCVVVHSNPKPFRTQTCFIVSNTRAKKHTIQHDIITITVKKGSWKNRKSNQAKCQHKEELHLLSHIICAFDAFFLKNHKSDTQLLIVSIVRCSDRIMAVCKHAIHLILFFIITYLMSANLKKIKSLS